MDWVCFIPGEYFRQTRRNDKLASFSPMVTILLVEGADFRLEYCPSN